MPGGDGTGPMGRGSFTGKGGGYCAGYVAPGFGCGRGWRRGMARRGFVAPIAPQALAYRESLEEQERYLEAQLREVRAQLRTGEEHSD